MKVGRPRQSVPWPALAGAVLALAGLALLALPADAAVIADPDGPLEQIHVSRVLPLDCQVMYEGVDYTGGESDGEFWGNGNPATSNSCGTWLRVGSVTYGPNVAAYALSGAPPAVEFTPLSQSGVTGSGSRSDPWTVETRVRAGPGGLVELRQTDTYVTGDGYYLTRIEVTNSGPPASFVLFRAGDCYLTSTQADNDAGDYGYGWRDPVTHGVACTEEPMGVDGRVIAWLPEPATPPAGFAAPAPTGQEDLWNVIFEHVGSGTPFADTCLCYTPDDNGGGLSWAFSLDPGMTAFAVSRNVFSPDGVPRAPPEPSRPAADFSYAAMRECTDNRILLRDRSQVGQGTVIGWAWDLGDATTATGPEVVHSYTLAGTYMVTLTVTSSAGLTSTVTKPVTSFADANCCPTLDRVPDIIVWEGQAFRIEVSGTDPDGDPLTFAATRLPPRATFDGRALDWATQSGDAGYYTVYFSATDGACADRGHAMVWVRQAKPGPLAADKDQDGIQDDADNCERVPNHAQADLDRDGTGDACDPSPCGTEPGGGARACTIPERTELQRSRFEPDDQDHDGIQDAADNCPAVANAPQHDSDGDSVGDACDLDVDGDGIVERSPAGLEVPLDNCPFRANPEQADLDGDGVGDACQPTVGASRVLASPEADPAMGAPANGPALGSNALLSWGTGLLVVGAPAAILLAQAVRRRRP